MVSGERLSLDYTHHHLVFSLSHLENFSPQAPHAAGFTITVEKEPGKSEVPRGIKTTRPGAVVPEYSQNKI